MVVSYGNALLRTGQAEAALGYEQIYDTFAVSADFVYLMGRIYMANERYPQAVEQFVKATTMDNCRFHGANSFLAFYHIGLICEKLGDMDNAMLYYKKCGDYKPALEKVTRMSLSADRNGAAHRRIVLFENDNFILQYIAEQYRKAFVKMGYEVFVFSSIKTKEDFMQNAEQMFLFHEKGLDAVLTFNNRGFRMQSEDGECLWDTWNVPCYNILVDHPMHYYETLQDSPARGVVVCSDRNHVKYVERFYPNVHQSFFLPTGGEELVSQSGVSEAVKERTIDVLFIGSYKYHSEYDYDALDEQVMDYLITHPTETFEQAVELCLKQTQPDITDDVLKETIEKHRFTDVNLSAMYRVEILRVLVENGITVTVYGNGWENTELYGNPHFLCHPPVSFEEGLALMSQSKIVLNQLAWFKDGASERIFNAMLQGAVSVTDDSIYLRQVLQDGENVVFYSLSEIERLPGIVGDLLRNPDRRQQIADTGYQAARDGHTWEHRARQLAERMFPENG
jgi:glycosyltransferase involved in cell wall biosynthesis